MARPTQEEIREKYEGEGYPIHVIGRHVDITEPIKNYAVEKLKKAKRFGVRIIDASITMDIQKVVHSVDYILNVNNIKVKVAGRSSNMYAACDEAIEHLEHILRRYTERLHMHDQIPLKEIEMVVNILPIDSMDDINDDIEEENLRKVEKDFVPHPIVSTEKRPVKILNQKEATLKMAASNDPFLIYKSEEDMKIKVIYRRDDGNFGIVEAQS